MRIAIDAMGGDRAPQAIIDGALAAIDVIEDDDELVLIGREDIIRQYLGEDIRWKSKISIVHAPEMIAMDDSPVDALRRKRKSSISIMARMGADKEVDAVVSAGNTGAYVAACQMLMRLLPGVSRPGILVVFPTLGGPVIACDVGANIAPKPLHLHQYAMMSTIYAREVVGIPNPTVSLISIGQEDAKGNELVKTTNQLLRDDPRINFVGNIEPREFINGPANIIICDGFVGNVILKLTEGIAESLFKAIAHEISLQKPDLIKFFQPLMDGLYAKHDYNEYGGAPLLGVDGTCMISHGSSNANGIKNAILRARQQVLTNINEKISQQLQRITVR